MTQKFLCRPKAQPQAIFAKVATLFGTLNLLRWSNFKKVHTNITQASEDWRRHK